MKLPNVMLEFIYEVENWVNLKWLGYINNNYIKVNVFTSLLDWRYLIYAVYKKIIQVQYKISHMKVSVEKLNL